MSKVSTVAKKKKISPDFSAISSFNLEPLEDGHNIFQELIKLSPIVVSKKTDEAKRDKRIHQLKYNQNSKDIPKILSQLVNFCFDDLDDGGISNFEVVYVASTYRSKVVVPRPATNTVGRYLFNMGFAEVYRMQRDSVTGMAMSDLVKEKIGHELPNERTFFAPANSYNSMGVSYLADYEIVIDSTPPPHKPVIMDINKPQQAPAKFTRMARQKVLVVVDLIGNEDQLEKLFNRAAAQIRNIPLSEIEKIGKRIMRGNGQARADNVDSKKEIKNVEKLMGVRKKYDADNKGNENNEGLSADLVEKLMAGKEEKKEEKEKEEGEKEKERDGEGVEENEEEGK